VEHVTTPPKIYKKTPSNRRPKKPQKETHPSTSVPSVFREWVPVLPIEKTDRFGIVGEGVGLLKW